MTNSYKTLQDNLVDLTNNEQLILTNLYNKIIMTLNKYIRKNYFRGSEIKSHFKMENSYFSSYRNIDMSNFSQKLQLACETLLKYCDDNLDELFDNIHAVGQIWIWANDDVDTKKNLKIDNEITYSERYTQLLEYLASYPHIFERNILECYLNVMEPNDEKKQEDYSNPEIIDNLYKITMHIVGKNLDDIEKFHTFIETENYKHYTPVRLANNIIKQEHLIILYAPILKPKIAKDIENILLEIKLRVIRKWFQPATKLANFYSDEEINLAKAQKISLPEKPSRQNLTTDIIQVISKYYDCEKDIFSAIKDESEKIIKKATAAYKIKNCVEEHRKILHTDFNQTQTQYSYIDSLKKCHII